MTLSPLAQPSAEQLQHAKQLQDALSATLNGWAVLEVNGDQARVCRVPQQEALFSELHALYGLHWSLEWHCYAEHTVRAALITPTARREGLAQAETLEAAQQLALAQALRAYGVYQPDEQWVEYDPEDGPNTAELPYLVQPKRTQALQTSQANMQLPPEPAPDPQMVSARGHIDRLMEELREAGRGKEVARIIVQHGGGYGKDLEESRAIYKELQALQKA